MVVRDAHLGSHDTLKREQILSMEKVLSPLERGQLSDMWGLVAATSTGHVGHVGQAASIDIYGETECPRIIQSAVQNDG